MRAPAVLVARPDHVRAIRAGGLRISGLEDRLVPVEAVEDCPVLTPGTLLLVAVKAHALEAAAADLRARLADDTVVAVLANSLEPDRLLGEALGRPVIRVIAQFGVSFEAPGHISSWGGRILMGPGAVEDRVADCLATCGLPVERDADLVRLSWEKLAMNCVANPLTALTGRRNREIVTEAFRDLRHALVAEVAALAAARGVVVAPDLAERIDTALSRSRNITSMLQDLRRGRPTEIDFLNGYVDRVSTGQGLEAPFNRVMAALVRARSATRRD